MRAQALAPHPETHAVGEELENVSVWVRRPWRQSSRGAVRQHALDHSGSLQSSRLCKLTSRRCAEYEGGGGFLLLVILVIDLSSCETGLELELNADPKAPRGGGERRVEWAGVSDAAARQSN